MTKYIFYIFVTSITIACSRYPNDVEWALKLAGDNRAELEQVLEYYRTRPEDSLKYRAACFLIGNMLGHAAVSVQLKDQDGQPYNDFIVDAHEYDSLSMAGYCAGKTIEPDIQYVSYNYLTEQIDLAFEAWAKPWAREVTFDDFSRYILPYRAQIEPLSSIRRYFLHTYGSILDTISGLTGSLEACRIINRVLRDSIRYHVALMKVPVTRRVEDTRKSGLGQCDDLCNFGIHVMRSVGIPVVVEKTLWPRMDAGHSWCSVLGSDGKWHAFGPGEVQPDELIALYARTPHNTLTKVYRITYESQADSRRDSLLEYPVPPAMFTNVSARDVSAEYIRTPEFTVNIDSSEPYSFLCIFNYGRWQAVDYSPVKHGQVSFRAGNGVVYMPHVYRDKILQPCGVPFLLEIDSVRQLIPDFDHPVGLRLEKKEIGGDQLLYWDTVGKTWNELTASGSNDTEQLYDRIPGNALLWHFTPEGSQRLGIVVDGRYKSY